MLPNTPRRYGSFLIKGKASEITAQLAAMAAREQGRVPSFDPEATASRKGDAPHDLMQRRSSPNLPVTVPQSDTSTASLEGV